MAKALALGADAIAIGTGAMIALNCNKEIPESNFEKEMGVPAGHCYHCHTGRCPVGVATQDPKLRKRLNPDDAALRVCEKGDEHLCNTGPVIGVTMPNVFGLQYSWVLYHLEVLLH